MNKGLLVVMMLHVAVMSLGQTTEIRYYNTQWLAKEVPKNKATVSKTIIYNEDQTITTKVEDLTRKSVLYSETYKGKEPWGTWKTWHKGMSLNYNFPLVYSERECQDSLVVRLDNYFRDNDSLRYKAPILKTGEVSIMEFVYRRIVYPQRALEEDIQGSVYVIFDIKTDGTVGNVAVKWGVNPILDKEAVRVINLLQFSSSAMFKDERIALNCVMVPIQFRISD